MRHEVRNVGKCFLALVAALMVPLFESPASGRTVIASQDFEGNTLTDGIPEERIAVALGLYDDVTGVYDAPGLGFDSGVGLGWTHSTDAPIPEGVTQGSDAGDLIGVVKDNFKVWGTTNGLAGAPGETGQYYLVEDADATWTLDFDPFDASGYQDLELSFTWGVDNDGGGVPAGAGRNFEDDDYFEVLMNGVSVWRIDGTGDYDLGTAVGGLDDLDAPYINAFAEQIVDVSAFDGQVINMSFVVANNTAPEDVAFDNILVTGIELPMVPGDYNTDGTVNAADYTVWRDNENMSFTLPNEDPAAATPGVVDQEDYSFWVANFGNSGTAESLAIPEPSTGCLLATCLLFTARGRAKQTRRKSAQELV